VAETLQHLVILAIEFGIAFGFYAYAVEVGSSELRGLALYALGPFIGLGLLFTAQRLIKTALEIYYTEYVITDRRTYSVTAIISRNLTSVPFEKVTNIGVRRNLFERIIHVDRVNLVAYGMKGTQIQMRGVEDTADVFRRLQHLTRAECSAENLLRAD
jgi:uncharacterized membrane protein YdbT with pleckstrin-like domain